MSIFTYSLIDEAGVKGSATVFVNHADTLTAAQLSAQAVVIGGLVDAITGAEIIDVKVSFHVTPDAGWKSAPVADLDMEQSLLLSFKIGATVYADEILIPCLRDSLIVDGQPDLTAAGSIDDFVQAVEAQTGLTGTSIVTKMMDSLSTLLAASVNFRSKRKARKAVSKVIVTN